MWRTIRFKGTPKRERKGVTCSVFFGMRGVVLWKGRWSKKKKSDFKTTRKGVLLFPSLLEKGGQGKIKVSAVIVVEVAVEITRPTLPPVTLSGPVLLPLPLSPLPHVP